MLGLPFLIEKSALAREIATLGDREGMTTAIPSIGVMVFFRPLGFAGVESMRGRLGINTLGG